MLAASSDDANASSIAFSSEASADPIPKTATTSEPTSKPKEPPRPPPRLAKYPRRVHRGLTHRLRGIASPPRGEDFSEEPPVLRCIDRQDGKSTAMSIRSGGHTLVVRFVEPEYGGSGVEVGVFEGGRMLWHRNVGSAGGADADGACSHNDWAVLVAGHYRHGNDVYDLLTGTKLGPGDVSAWAPDASFGLVPPQFSWAGDFYRWSRTFRIDPHEANRPRALDTPPVPSEWIDGGAESDDRRVAPDMPSVAISFDSSRYAIISPAELAVYRSSDDQAIAVLDSPRYETTQRNDPSVYRADALRFSRSGTYLSFTQRSTEDGDERTDWYAIEPR